MNKILIVSHLDDEILWFNPSEFDKIIICFWDRADDYNMYLNRKKALKQHPLKDKIKNLDIPETLYQKNHDHDKFIKCYETLKTVLAEDIANATEIYTHNSWGEYGHPDHILVHQVVTELAKCPVYCDDCVHPATVKDRFAVKVDTDLYRRIKAVYVANKVWTWIMDYEPKDIIYFYKAN